MNAVAAPRAPFPWKAVMAAGLGRMRLAPKDFWSMTPRELAAVLDPAPLIGPAPNRSDLALLMRAYPDNKEN